MNKTAVALAADSAVTITTAQGQKIYNTNKLFAISKYHPVGIMVYSDAELMGLPRETIIKVYRQSLGTRNYESLMEFGDLDSTCKCNF
jgi:urease accessory protein UreH